MQSQAIMQQMESTRMNTLIQTSIASNEKATMDRNATVLEQQAAVNTQAGNEAGKRTREDYARLMAAHRSQASFSGVVDSTGSSVFQEMQIASESQRALDENTYQTEQQRRGLFREADNQRADGTKAELEIFGAQARGGAARLASMNALTQSQFDLQATKANSTAMRRQGFADLLQNSGNLFGSGYNMAQKTPGNSFFRSKL